jgi:hypothetical protein
MPRRGSGLAKGGVVRTSAGTWWLLTVVGCLSGLATCAVAEGRKDEKSPQIPAYATLHIPKLERGPKLEDFLGMRPSPAFEGKMLKVDNFIQRDPKDGAPASQKTEVYLGYTPKNLYVVCVCFDSEPSKIRARMSRREQIDADDQFGFVLDTFNDKKHGVFFYMNPLGIQQDGIWDEDQGPDSSYDMLWNSEARLTPQGYVEWFEIPFRSLRFHPRENQTWGIFFERDIRRNNEASFYPRITSNAQGFLAQETEMDGMEHISPGRNLQFIPYASARSFRNLDDRDLSEPHFHGKHIEPRLGLDSKIVLKDSLVLDATINPDFAQVESDDPQITVNQRFEVFFPEKRPFFLENSNFFATPVNLVFTRRIADPEFGVRLTGKTGPWAIGAFFADDKSPGESVLPTDPLSGAKAYFSVIRVSHDLWKGSTIGFILTDRELNTVPLTVCSKNPCVIGQNRVAGVDTKLKISSKWIATIQAMTSYTKFNDGTHKGGPSYDVFLERSSRRIEFNVSYQDTAANFDTETGFFRRPDVRRYSQFLLYRFYREGKKLQWHGPSLTTINNWDHRGTRLEWYGNLNYRWIFQRQTDFGVYANLGHERLRPVDFSALSANQDYAHNQRGFFFDFGYFKQLSIGGEVNWGQATNFNPANGPPVLARSNFASLYATLRPVKGLVIDNSYLLQRLRDEIAGADFNNHILRSKWNYQFTREFSFRFIGQYTTVLSNPLRSSLQSTKQFNVDALLTYLVHPGTAVYLGYNSDLQNLSPTLGLDPSGNIFRTRSSFLNDGRQIFIKISYLLHY